MASKSQAGRGVTIGIGVAPGTTIGEVKNVKRSGQEWKREDVTNMSTSGNTTEKLATILEEGTVEISGNRVSADAGQIALETAFESGIATNFVITLPKTATQTVAGDTYTFSAIVVSQMPGDLDVTKTITFSAKLDITGNVVFAVGS
jgi:predicted secreted protein